MNTVSTRLLLVLALLTCPAIIAFSQQIPQHAPQRSMFIIPDFSVVVEQQMPTVVGIRVTKVDDGSDNPMRIVPPSPIPPKDPSKAPKEGEKQPDGSPREQTGSGSGFIIKSDGFIVTNAHVVDKATDIVVRLANKRQYKAKLIGIDTKADVAVIKIEATNLPTVKIGDPNASKVGQWVIAVGSPYGFFNTVSAGIISAKDRMLPTNMFVRFIQTDAAINPGSSGGPLFNVLGEVIGINSDIFSPNGSSAGLSFSIPIDTAMDIANQLQANGKITRGRIGLQIQSLTDESAKALGLTDSAGALVADVVAGASAAAAGIKVGDVILSFGDKKIEDSSDLPMVVGAVKPGTETTITVWRTGATLVLKIVVGELK